MAPAVAAVAAYISAQTVVAFFVKLAISMAISYIAGQLLKKDPSSSNAGAAEIIRDLEIPNSRPPYRYVYGRYRMYGSPAPWRVIGNTLYGCLILNSRPSAGGDDIKIYLDKRDIIDTEGNIFDFSGDGLRCQLPEPAKPFPADQRPRFWLGLGDQVSPPDRIVNNASKFFMPSDGWRGRTVLWIELQAGDSAERTDRWPRVPPEIEVEMNYSVIYDPRDITQNPEDSTTWKFSNNHALVLLDALRTNPIRQYSDANLMMETYIEAANVSDENITLKNGGGEKRYTANGAIIWEGGEIETQIQPIVDSGAGTLIGASGRLGYLAGAYRAPIYKATDMLTDDGIEYQTLVPSRDLPSGIVTVYIAPDRDWQEADLPAYAVPGAPPIIGDAGITNIDLPFCTSPTQAMRVQKIAAMRLAAQRKLSITLPPDAFNIIAGANITTEFNGLEQLNGEWEITAINPGISLAQPDGGVALRCPCKLSETNEKIYAWDASEEYDLTEEAFDPERPALAPPTDLYAESGPEWVVSGLPRIRFSFAPSTSGSVTHYEWQYRALGGNYEQGGDIDVDIRADNGRVFGFATPLQAGQTYDIRVRAVSDNRTSDWVTLTDILAIGDTGLVNGGNLVNDITVDGVRWRVHYFFNDGTLEVVLPGNIEYLIVAGGGAGGAVGGGGGGGVIAGNYPAQVPQIYNVVVGSGGNAVVGDAHGGAGGDSMIFNFVAVGGGGGAGFSSAGAAATDGGSGGGGGSDGITAAGTGTDGQGYDGGTGYSSTTYPYIGAGGGGAGAAGSDATADKAGSGGDGYLSSITGIPTYYAGGGAGSVYSNMAATTAVDGDAGLGGSAVGKNGGVNTGAGGGARKNVQGGSNTIASGAGGSGIIIIRYRI